MPLGPGNPEWLALCQALADLTAVTGAANAVVMDAFNDLWARAEFLDAEQQAHAFALLERALSGVDLPRGGQVEIASEEPQFFAVSFAGIYVLIVWFREPFAASWIRAVIRRELPRIESLTVRLPPPDGSSRPANAQRVRRPT